jgi:NodT family efflux transporter outer membrane factor (OMF) lipoprotein
VIRRPLRALLAASACATALAACTVGPSYQRPAALPGQAQIPAAFKESQGWTPSKPLDAIDRGAWWSVFNDPVLDGLERRVAVTNQNIAAAEAAYRAARATVDQNRANFFPTVGVTAGATHTRTGAGVASGAVVGSGGGSTITSGGAAITRGNVGVSATWEADVWGRIRRTVEQAGAAAQASAADLQTATLSAQAQLAINYFQLRQLDEQKRLLQATVAAYQKSLKLTQNQYDAGIVARADVISALTQVQNTQAQAVDVDNQRAAREHAIALLVGVTPADLSLAPAVMPREAPVVPTGLPSTLLERRPDIASAERSMASANAAIGVAVAAYYPSLTLNGSGSSNDSAFSRLFRVDNFIWSVGPQLAETVLDFGARKARVRVTRAQYDQTVANYRQTVLAAFQNVEDQLAALRVLEQEQTIRLAAEASARQAEAIALNQYQAGQTTFTSVITAQAQSLAAQQATLQVMGSRLNASVGLIQALGGGWTTAELPPR